MKPFLKISVGARTPDLHGGLRVAVGHLTVDEKNIEGSFMGSPNVSRQRKKVLSELLNDVVKHGVRHPELALEGGEQRRGGRLRREGVSRGFQPVSKPLPPPPRTRAQGPTSGGTTSTRTTTRATT